MKIVKTAVALTITALFATPALAQDVDDFIERNARQQERIEQGLRSGTLSVQEAAALEYRAAQIERYQSRALADGAVSAEELRRIDRMQDRFGRQIHREAHDNETGNPNSRSAQRFADDVARNANQQNRIANGVRSGDLTYREAARLEYGQSHVNRRQAYAGADGHVGRHEQHGIRHAQNHQSRNIWRERHDGQNRGERHGGWRQHEQRDLGWHTPRHSQNREHPGYNGQHRGWESSAARSGNSGGQGFNSTRSNTQPVAANTTAPRARGGNRGRTQ
jgi:hypothetical protein